MREAFCQYEDSSRGQVGVPPEVQGDEVFVAGRQH